MSDSGSLSRVEPNLMNCGSLTFLNLSLVVLSKHRTMLSMSSINAESERWSKGGSHSIFKGCNIPRKVGLVTFKELTGVDADENWSIKMTLQTAISEDSTSDKSLTLGRRNFLKAIRNAIWTLAVSTDIEGSASCVYDNDALSCLERGRFKKKSWSGKRHTSIASAGRPFSIEKWRLASPSVTKETRERPRVLSGIRPAIIAACRIWLCWGPSHPLGWESTKWISSSREFHNVRPFACVSWM